MWTRAFIKTAAAICLLAIVAAPILVVAQDLPVPAPREPLSATQPPIVQPLASQPPGSPATTTPVTGRLASINDANAFSKTRVLHRLLSQHSMAGGAVLDREGGPHGGTTTGITPRK